MLYLLGSLKIVTSTKKNKKGRIKQLYNTTTTKYRV